MQSTPKLIVSVRTIAEVRAALAGGCQLIDIKDPDQGPLGRADDDTVLGITAAVQHCVPVSAALGELAESDAMPAFVAELQYVKWGLAGMAGRAWRESLREFAVRCPAVCVVAVYADAKNAQSPSVENIVDFVCDPSWPGRVLLLDTFDKSPQNAGRPLTLLDWLSLDRLAEVCVRCRESGVRVALAGSLGEPEVRAVAELKPDWIAVRGAVCDQNDRRRGVQAQRVRALRKIIDEVATAAAFAG